MEGGGEGCLFAMCLDSPLNSKGHEVLLNNVFKCRAGVVKEGPASPST